MRSILVALCVAFTANSILQDYVHERKRVKRRLNMDYGLYGAGTNIVITNCWVTNYVTTSGGRYGIIFIGGK